MNVEISEELQPIYAALDKILLRLDELEDRSLPEWVSLEEACKLKGIDKKTAQNQPWMQPLQCERRRVGGSRDWKWPRAVVLDWLTKSDEELKAEWRRRLRAA